MKARGGYEVPGSQMPWFIALHVAAPLAMVAEVVFGGARPEPAWLLYLSIWVMAEWLRDASMRALGDRWSARIVVVPGERPVTRGPYRWFPHPIYLAVTLELLAMPLLFGAWRTAIGAGVVNAALVATRVRRERAALAGVAATRDV